MARRNKKPSGLEVRVSHEETRQSKAWLAAAFEAVVPIVERRVERQSICRQDVGAAVPKHVKYTVGR